MFWTDIVYDYIRRARLDGTEVVTLINTGLSCSCTSDN